MTFTIILVLVLLALCAYNVFNGVYGLLKGEKTKSTALAFAAATVSGLATVIIPLLRIDGWR